MARLNSECTEGRLAPAWLSPFLLFWFVLLLISPSISPSICILLASFYFLPPYFCYPLLSLLSLFPSHPPVFLCPVFPLLPLSASLTFESAYIWLLGTYCKIMLLLSIIWTLLYFLSGLTVSFTSNSSLEALNILPMRPEWGQIRAAIFYIPHHLNKPLALAHIFLICIC